MVSNSFSTRLRSLIVLGCIMLTITFYWDFKVLHILYNSPRPSYSPNLRLNKSFGWIWECVRTENNIDVCQRVMGNLRLKSSLTLESCSMICSPGRNIWPFPTGTVKVRNTTASFHPRLLKVDFKSVNDRTLSSLLKRTTKLYQEKITKLARKSHDFKFGNNLTVTIQLTKKDNAVRYRISIDESYRLSVSQKGSRVEAIIQASTFLGAHHGLETLLQLIWWDDRDLVLKILNNAVVTDAPVFTYRGLLLDTAKHFLPLQSILRTIDAMATVKLNVFHWRLTGSHSFPFASSSFPSFKVYGPYSPREVYTPADVRRVVEYAEVRAVTVMVEVDAPSHTGQGWEWGVEEGKGNLTLCCESCPHPPCGQINPGNADSYSVLGKLLKELNVLTRADSLMHLGGDDVNLNCWRESEEVTNMEAYLSKGVIGVWEVFYQQIFDKLVQEKIPFKNFILWSNDLLNRSNFWKSLRVPSPIVQSKSLSTSKDLERLVRYKFRVIVSSRDTWDLNEEKNWISAYKYRPWVNMTHQHKKLVLGGEALAWTDRASLEPSLWPSSAAVAERLWSDPGSSAIPSARLARLRERLLETDISCSPVEPRWCTQNPYECS